MIGNKIRELRLQHHMSQVELSKVLHVSQQTITKWENGKAEPSSGALASIAKYFNVSADYLIGNPKKADLDDKDVLFTYKGKPLSDEDRAIIERLMNGKADE